jgi:two-component system NtrC family sensor kinase
MPPIAFPFRPPVQSVAAPLGQWLLGEHAWILAALTAVVALIVGLSYVAALNRRLRKLSANLESQLAERNRVEAALLASEAFYHSLVEHLPLNIIRKDADGRFTFGNPRFCEEIKRPLEELRGKTDFDLFPAHLAEKYRADDQAVMSSRKSLEAIEEHDPGDGNKIYVQVIKTPVLDTNGTVVGTQGSSGTSPSAAAPRKRSAAASSARD